MTTINEAPIVEDRESAAIRQFVACQTYPLLYATVHGSRLYGFDTPDSDRDLRGCHVLPSEQVLGLQEGPDTLTSRDDAGDRSVELVTHEVRKIFRLLLKRNGNVLEEVLSPLVLVTGGFHDELKEIAACGITRGYAGHYMGMASQVKSVLEKPDRREIKHALHMYRAFLTGIHLMETGELECNLRVLNSRARFSHVSQLLERRIAGKGDQKLVEGDAQVLAAEFDRLMGHLKQAADKSHLPAQPSGSSALNDLLVRIRRSAQFQ